jgi:hypothetical protein
LVDHWEQLGCCQDSVDFTVGGVEVLLLLNGFLIEFALCQPLVEGFVEAVEFVFGGFDTLNELLFGHPLAVQVASPPELDEVFLIECAIPAPFPDDVADFEVKDTVLVVVIFVKGIEGKVVG